MEIVFLTFRGGKNSVQNLFDAEVPDDETKIILPPITHLNDNDIDRRNEEEM